jgi:hypothetical protein
MEAVINTDIICENCGNEWVVTGDNISDCATGAWFVAQAEALDDEDECHDDCFCEECRSAWDEYEELSRDYRRSTSGY